MPALSDTEIETGIGDGSIFALALDTSIFDRFGCDLHHPRLAALEQLPDSKLQLLLPEIVARGVLDHLARHAADSQAAARKALADYRRRWQKEISEEPEFEGEAEAEAARQLERFLARTGGRRIPLTDPPDLAARVAELYFSAEPPFERREAKKHEFPDALALLSLEALAARRRRRILCVSPDKGWQSFCAGSDDLVWVEDLDTALSFRNRSGRARAEDVWRSLRDRGGASFYYEPLHIAFRERSRGLDFIPEIRALLEHEATPVLEDLDRIDFATSTPPVVIDTDAETVTFTFRVKAHMIFIADFSFYAHQTVTDEAIEVAAARRDVEKTVEYEVLLTVDRKDGAPHSVRRALVDRPLLRLSFGAIDPFER